MQCIQQDPFIIIRDFNAKVGEGRDENGEEPIGLMQGEKLVKCFHTNNLMVRSTWFQQPTRRKWTWKNPDEGSRNQIDYILISKRFRNMPLSSKTTLGQTVIVMFQWLLHSN